MHEGTRDGGFFPDKMSSNSFGLLVSFGSESSRFFLFWTLSIVGTFRKAKVERSASINLKQTNHEKVIFQPIKRMNSRKRTYSAISEHWTIAAIYVQKHPYEHSAEAARPPCNPPRRTRPTPHHRPSDWPPSCTRRRTSPVCPEREDSSWGGCGGRSSRAAGEAVGTTCQSLRTSTLITCLKEGMARAPTSPLFVPTSRTELSALITNTLQTYM